MRLKTYLCVVALGLGCACGPDFSSEGLGTEIGFEPNRPGATEPREVEPYEGDDPHVMEAQQRFRTGLDLQRKVVQRTCTPNDGVCHNKKEYPDLHTPANLVAAIDAACNVQPGDVTSVYDRCERVGDRFTLEQFDEKIEVAWIERIEGEAQEFSGENPPDETSPGLHVRLRESVPLDQREVRSAGLFLRLFGNEEIVFARYRTRWWRVGDDHLVGEVGDRQTEEANQLVSVGIRQGDMNRNGTFGADLGPNIPLINPGKPEESYLIARMRGEIQGEDIPGSRMPLANQPLNISEMLALFCWVEGLPSEEVPDLDWPIDYRDCSYSADPEGLNLLGEGVTWSQRISKIFEANCGGCHGGAEPSEGLDFLAEDAYDQLLQPSKQVPELNLIEPGNPEQSYLWLKLIADERIEGEKMPANPLTGEGSLTEAEMGDIETWIVNGAQENE